MERRFSDPQHRLPDGRMPLDAHRVGELYQQIIDVIRNPRLIPDAAFDESSYEFQASWDEWGRGYRPAPYLLDAEGNKAEDADPDEPAAVHKTKAHGAVAAARKIEVGDDDGSRTSSDWAHLELRRVLRARRPGGNPHRSGRSPPQDCETGRSATPGPQQAPERFPRARVLPLRPVYRGLQRIVGRDRQESRVVAGEGGLLESDDAACAAAARSQIHSARVGGRQASRPDVQHPIPAAAQLSWPLFPARQNAACRPAERPRAA